jgi:hypothetical protein
VNMSPIPIPMSHAMNRKAMQFALPWKCFKTMNHSGSFLFCWAKTVVCGMPPSPIT